MKLNFIDYFWYRYIEGYTLQQIKVKELLIDVEYSIKYRDNIKLSKAKIDKTFYDTINALKVIYESKEKI